MTHFSRIPHFSAATPIIPRNLEYEKPKASRKPRDITTQVRDWLHDNGLTEVWIEPGKSSVWRYKGKVYLEILTTKDNGCLIYPDMLLRLKIYKCMIIKRLSRTWKIANANDLHMVKPLVRLALNQAESQRLRDVDLVRRRMIKCETAILQKVFIEGIQPKDAKPAYVGFSPIKKTTQGHHSDR